jgi:hypothetical protein
MELLDLPVQATKACTAKPYHRRKAGSHCNPAIRSLSMIWVGRYTRLAGSRKHEDLLPTLSKTS